MKITAETANKLKELLDKHYYGFIRTIRNLEDKDFDEDGIINEFINNFDYELNFPLDNFLKENNIEWSYQYNKYIDYNEGDE